METEYSRRAQAFLARQPEKRAERIKAAVNLLPAGDVKKLKGIKNGYRLRVGDVRVLFAKDDDKLYVVKIDNRGDIYK
jgi:mRNA interferase RelE/StbE